MTSNCPVCNSDDVIYYPGEYDDEPNILSCSDCGSDSKVAHA